MYLFVFVCCVREASASAAVDVERCRLGDAPYFEWTWKACGSGFFLCACLPPCSARFLRVHVLSAAVFRESMNINMSGTRIFPECATSNYARVFRAAVCVPPPMCLVYCQQSPDNRLFRLTRFGAQADGSATANIPIIRLICISPDAFHNISIWMLFWWTFRTMPSYSFGYVKSCSIVHKLASIIANDYLNESMFRCGFLFLKIDRRHIGMFVSIETDAHVVFARKCYWLHDMSVEFNIDKPHEHNCLVCEYSWGFRISKSSLQASLQSHTMT